MINPSLNVLRPTASTLATSSYVNVPAIPTSPVTVRVPPIDTLPLNIPCPVTLKLSSIVVVPPAESIVKSPDEVSISLSPETPICTLSTAAPPVTFKSVPLNVKLALSSTAPELPAIRTRSVSYTHLRAHET